MNYKKIKFPGTDTSRISLSKHQLGVTGVAPERRTPEYLAKFVVSEIEKWAGPIKAAGVSGE